MGTDSEMGTGDEDIARLLRGKGLKVSTSHRKSIAVLKQAIDSGAPAIVWMKTRFEDHWVVVYGYSDDYLWILDPSLRKSYSCRQRKAVFRKRWSGFSMVVRRKGK
jgi:predicted double-glycine peptidase